MYHEFQSIHELYQALLAKAERGGAFEDAGNVSRIHSVDLNYHNNLDDCHIELVVKFYPEKGAGFEVLGPDKC